MLLFVLVLFLIFHRRRWYYGYPCWSYPVYRGYGPYAPTSYGWFWNGYAWQPSGVYGHSAYPYRGYAQPYR